MSDHLTDHQQRSILEQTLEDGQKTSTSLIPTPSPPADQSSFAKQVAVVSGQVQDPPTGEEIQMPSSDAATSGTHLIPPGSEALAAMDTSSSPGRIQDFPSVSGGYVSGSPSTSGQGQDMPLPQPAQPQQGPSTQNYILGSNGQPLVFSGTTFFTGGLPTALAAATEAALRGAGCPVTYGTVIPQYTSSTLGNQNQTAAAGLQTPTTTPTPTASQTSSSGGNESAPTSAPVPVPAKTPSKEDQNQNTTKTAPQANVAAGADNSSRLKVEDALNYLDKVKNLFRAQPHHYSDFLDIMREFKKQSLETEVIINRVVQLFSGQPELIMGFNKFLPPGYRIAVQLHPLGPEQQQGMGMGYTITTTVASSSGTPVVISCLTQQQQPASPAPASPVRPAAVLPHCSTTSKALSGFGALALPPNPNTPPAPVRLPAIVSVGNSFRPIGGGSTIPSTSFSHSPGSSFVQTQNPNGSPPPQAPSLNIPAVVEFNLALDYVNKIKSRFLSQPDQYQKFLDILNTYRKQQRCKQQLNEGDGGTPTKGPWLTESEIYKRVSSLFHDHEDLLEGFGRFLPEVVQQASPAPAASITATQNRTPLLKKTEKRHLEVTNKPSKKQNQQRWKDSLTPTPSTSSSSRTSLASTSKSPKKSATAHPTKRLLLNPLPAKKTRSSTTSSLPLKTYGSSSSGTGKLVGTHHQDVAFFDKVRAHLRLDHAYENFVRILQLHNKGVFSGSETVTMITPFLSTSPELLARFKDFMGHCEQAKKNRRGDSVDQDEPVPRDQRTTFQQQDQEQPSSSQDQDHVREINYASCKRLGTSYCAIPLNFEPPKCSGRTSLCDSVLNDAYVNFPTNFYDDSPIKTAWRNPYELQMSNCEDERFELDLVLDSNRDTIGWLEALQLRMSRMSPAQLEEFKLDDDDNDDGLGGGGELPTIHLRSIKRVYGEKAGALAIEGLINVPPVALPLIIKRLKQKDEEWREAQKSFNSVWGERQEQCYLKSLDHQGLYFRQGDIRALKSKTLIREIEAKYNERLDLDESSWESPSSSQPTDDQPHLTLPYRDRSVFDDALNLILHRVRQQETISRKDKQEIKKLLKQFIPDLFSHPRMELSDDDEEDVDEPRSPRTMNGATTSTSSKKSRKRKRNDKEQGSEPRSDSSSTASSCQQESRRTLAKRSCKSAIEFRKQQKKEGKFHKISGAELKFLFMDSDKLERYKMKHRDQEESYKLFFGNNTWYVFLRLHQILCERLTQFWETTVAMSEREQKESREQKSTANALGLRSKPEVETEDYYTAFLELVKDLLDGNVDAGSYEDQLLQMFGIHAYVGYTMDEVITNAVRLLQRLVTAKGCRDCLKFYLDANQKGGTGGPIATASQRARDEWLYRCRSEKVFGETNCIKVTIFQKSSVMTVELLDGGSSSPPKSQPTPEEQAEWTSYMKDCMNPGSISEGNSNFVNAGNPLKLFLNRNISKLLTEDEIMKADGTSKPDEIEGQLASCQIPIRVPHETNLVEAAGSQHSISPSSYEMVSSSVGAEDYFYRRGALWKSRKSHKTVSLSMWKRFQTWHGDWLMKNTTMGDKADWDAWLKGTPKYGHGKKKHRKNILKVIISDPEDEVPYHQYRRYVMK